MGLVDDGQSGPETALVALLAAPEEAQTNYF